MIASTHGDLGLWCQPNEAIKRIGEVGRRQWRKKSGAHRQARAENRMYRFKRIIGDHLRAKHHEAQKTEALIVVNIINRMTALGMPDSAKSGVTASDQTGGCCPGESCNNAVLHRDSLGHSVLALSISFSKLTTGCVSARRL